MVTMFVRHNVTDFAKWKQVYDGLETTQQRMGVTADSIFRAADNPNDVTVTHEFASLEAAQAFAASSELHDAMMQAGVAGQPTVWFAAKV